MIKDERELQQAIEQLGRMYHALAALRADILPKDPELFRVMAEGPVDQIEELTRDIHGYSGASTAGCESPGRAGAWKGADR